MTEQSGRTKAKIKENLGLLMDFINHKYGSRDPDTEQILFSALSWTADDVQEQCEAAQPTVAEGTETPWGKVIKYGPAYWCTKEGETVAIAVSAGLIESVAANSTP